MCLSPAAMLMAAGVAAAAATGCHVAVNDFWGSTILAAQADPLRPSTWFSGFFPFAYHLLLSLVPVDLQVRTAYSASVAAGVITTGFVGWTVARWLPSGLATLAGFALASWPIFFLYATTPNPDLVATALTTIGIATLLSEINQEKASGLRLTGAALFLGAASLLRYHFAILAFGACAGWAVARGVRNRSMVVLTMTTVGTASLQILVSLVAGHGPLATAQGFNVHRMMYGADWSSLSSTTPVPSVGEVILADPWRFAAAYWLSFGALLPFALPVVLAVAVIVGSRARSLLRPAVLLAAVQITYIVVVAAGASSRAVLPLLPLAVMSAALAAAGFAELTATVGRRARRPLGIGIALFLAAMIGRNAVTDMSATSRRAGAQRSLVAIEAELRRAGVESPSHVFTTDLSYYLPGMPPHVPWATGGWYRLDVPDYDRRFPALCHATPECLVQGASAHGVRAVVIPPGWRTAAGELWADQLAPVGARRISAPAGWTLFRIEGSSR